LGCIIHLHKTQGQKYNRVSFFRFKSPRQKENAGMRNAYEWYDRLSEPCRFLISLVSLLIGLGMIVFGVLAEGVFLKLFGLAWILCWYVFPKLNNCK